MKLKIRGKLILSFGAVMVMVLCTLGVITYQTFANSIEKNKEQIAALHTQATQLRLSNILNRYLADIRNFDAQLGERTQLWSGDRRLTTSMLVDDHLMSHQLLSAIFVTDAQGGEYIAGGDTRDQLARLDKYIFGNPHVDIYQSENPIIVSAENQILIAYPHYKRGTSELTRITTYFVPIEAFHDLVSWDIQAENSLLLVTQGDETLFSLGNSTNESLAGIDVGQLNQAAQTADGLFQLESTYIFSSNLPRLGWTLFYVIPEDNYLRELIDLKNRVIAATVVALWVSIWIVLIIAHRISHPIRSLSKATHDIQAFNYSTPLVFKNTGDEIGDLASSFETMRLHIKSLVSKDPLTGTYNRRFLMHTLELEIAKAQRFKKDLACLMMDLDHFKRINDTYGHQCGDYVLKEAAEIIKESLRKYDVVARYGGEEFFIVLPLTDAETAYQIAERTRKKLEHHPLEWEGQKIRVTMSIGASALKPDVNEASNYLIETADKALYQAKNGGRNQTLIYDHQA